MNKDVIKFATKAFLAVAAVFTGKKRKRLRCYVLTGLLLFVKTILV